MFVVQYFVRAVCRGVDVKNAVARNAKALRKKRKLTLAAAAELTGVSRSMLAQIEKGDVNPTISVLWKIANGFEVSFTSLIKTGVEPVTILRCQDTEPLSEDWGKYLNYPTFVFDEKKSFENCRIVIKSGGELLAQPHLAGTEEYITLFAGEAEVLSIRSVTGSGGGIPFASGRTLCTAIKTSETTMWS